jgi:hypothetical protein
MKEITYKSALFYLISTIPVIGIESLKRVGLSYVMNSNKNASNALILNLFLMIFAIVFAFGCLITQFVLTNR